MWPLLVNSLNSTYTEAQREREREGIVLHFNVKFATRDSENKQFLRVHMMLVVVIMQTLKNQHISGLPIAGFRFQ